MLVSRANAEELATIATLNAFVPHTFKQRCTKCCTPECSRSTISHKCLLTSTPLKNCNRSCAMLWSLIMLELALKTTLRLQQPAVRLPTFYMERTKEPFTLGNYTPRQRFLQINQASGIHFNWRNISFPPRPYSGQDTQCLPLFLHERQGIKSFSDLQFQLLFGTSCCAVCSLVLR